jgi:RNA polymerase sigma-70 factor (ECF subfamily)
VDQATGTLPRSPEAPRLESPGSSPGGRPTASDEEIVARVRAGETPLFELLMRRYNQRVYRTARAIVRDEGEAEDVMQQAYVSAFAHLHQYEGRARFSTWLTRIAVHEASARARRRARWRGFADVAETPSSSDSLPDGRPDPEQQAQASELRQVLDDAIDALPGIYRAAFVLREAEGLAMAEIADCLEISEVAVRARVHRARALLRRRLYQRTGATSASAFSFYLTRCDRVVAGVFARLGVSRTAAGPGTTLEPATAPEPAAS